MGRLDNKIALVTGAGSGIGRAIALRFAEEGATVIASDIESHDRTAAIAVGRVEPITCDVGEPRQVEALFSACRERFGRLDILCNNAGIARGGHRLHELTLEDFDLDLLAEPRARTVWRVSVPPASGATVAAALGAAALFYDWGGGLIWAAMPEDLQDGGAAAIRAAVAPHEGHATLVRGAAGLRASVDVFQPLAAPLAALSARVKAGFDPLDILNPGRMVTHRA